MTNKVRRKDVEKWVGLLRSGDEQSRLRAAAALARLGIQAQQEVGGTLESGALTRMSEEQVSVLLEALSDTSPRVREEVAFALGEWAGEMAVKALQRLVTGEEKDPEWRVRAAAADALGRIGGPQAVKTLQELALTDINENVRARAVTSLAVLAKETGKEALKQPSARPVVRTRGAVRTRGISPIRELRPQVGEILDLFKRIRAEDPSDLVRQVADGALAELGE